MKTNLSRLRLTTVLVAGMAFIQATHTAQAQRIDPATGQPAAGLLSGSHVDPRTGFRVSDKDGQPIFSTDTNTASAAFDAINRETFAKGAALMEKALGPQLYELHGLVANARYDEALTRLREFHKQRKDTQSFMSLLFAWFDLGRKFPKAREALIEIRDQDVREFSKGHRDADLFWEVKLISSDLKQDDVTCALFRAVDKRDKQLAGQCYPYAEEVLIQKGEYALCLSHIGDAQASFVATRTEWERQRTWIAKMDEIHRASQERLAETLKAAREMMQERERKIQEEREVRLASLTASSGGRFTPPPAVPAVVSPRVTPPQFTPPDMGKMATDRFVGKICRLIEVLVGTGRKAAAEMIRDEAVSVLEDARLRSAVGDAEVRIQHRVL